MQLTHLFVAPNISNLSLSVVCTPSNPVRNSVLMRRDDSCSLSLRADSSESTYKLSSLNQNTKLFALAHLINEDHSGQFRSRDGEECTRNFLALTHPLARKRRSADIEEGRLALCRDTAACKTDCIDTFSRTVEQLRTDHRLASARRTEQ